MLPAAQRAMAGGGALSSPSPISSPLPLRPQLYLATMAWTPPLPSRSCTLEGKWGGGLCRWPESSGAGGSQALGAGCSHGV